MLKGRCALITGSTQGLGQAMARRLAAEGCDIVLNGFGDPAEIEAQRSALEAEHGIRALHHGADLAESRQIADLIETAGREFGGVDILINNAVVRHFAPVEKFQPEDWDRALAVNLSAAFHTTRLVLAGMRARGFGRILNISSVYGLFGGVNGRLHHDQDGADRPHPCRGAGDGARQHHLQRHLPQAPRPARRSSSGCRTSWPPRGWRATRQWRGSWPAVSRRAASWPWKASPPWPSFLCSPGAADITGAALPVDGGWSAS